jgi:hypothetical protein
MALCGSLLLIAAHASARELTYPLFGNFRAEEGTMELWFSCQAPLDAPAGGDYQVLMSLFELSPAGASAVVATIFARGGKLHLSFSMHDRGAERGLLPISGPLTEPIPVGRVVHLAWTWRGRDMAVFVDGKLFGTRAQASVLAEATPGDLLRVGSSPGMVLHALRISTVARDAQALARPRPDLDVHPLLLDCFDSAEHVSADGSTRAQLVSGLMGESGGKVSPPFAFVSKPAPGLALDGTALH